MIARLVFHYEKVLLVGVILLLACSGFWLQRYHATLARRVHGPGKQTVGGVDFGLRPAETPAPVREAWPEPRGQSHGDEWRYELFGPPDIALDHGRGAFVVRPNLAEPKAMAPAETVPEMIEVLPEPFRVQLVGSIGDDADLRAILRDSATSETFLARPNQRFEGLGVSVSRVGYSKITVHEDEFGPVHEVVLVVHLFDERANEEVRLMNGVKRFTGRLRVALRLEGDRREFFEGAAFSLGGWAARVDRIQKNPDEVCISRTRPGKAQVETLVLRPGSEPSLPPETVSFANSGLQQRLASQPP
jgi:hypothetical protein